MPELIIPGEEPAKKDAEAKPQVTIINNLKDWELDPDELAAAHKSMQSNSVMLVSKEDVAKAIKQQIAGWANWFALFYPQMPKAFDAALKIIGYKVTKET